MRVRRIVRGRFYLSLALIVLAPSTVSAQRTSLVTDTVMAPNNAGVMLESTAGAAVGGFLGILAAIRPGCGSFVHTGHCRVPTMAIGFGVGTLVGIVAGAVHSTRAGRCPFIERLSRSLTGAIIGLGASVPIAAASRGYLRIGVAPLVPLSGAAGSTIALRHCI